MEEGGRVVDWESYQVNNSIIIGVMLGLVPRRQGLHGVITQRIFQVERHGMSLQVHRLFINDSMICSAVLFDKSNIQTASHVRVRVRSRSDALLKFIKSIELSEGVARAAARSGFSESAETMPLILRRAIYHHHHSF